MKVSLSSLKEYIDINLPTHDLCQVLTLGGIEVDEVIETSLKFSGIEQRLFRSCFILI